MRVSRVLIIFFVVSGFCSLVYQVVWLRLVMAQLGVTTPMVSILLSVFMAGLALGSWLAGVLADRLQKRSPSTAIRFYAVAELLISLSVFVVRPGLVVARRTLATWAIGAFSSFGYYIGAGIWTAVLLLPFCVAMGATLPFAMWAIRSQKDADAPRSFSGLYLANVLGATFGTITSALVFIELLGFNGTLNLAASLNAFLAALALAVSLALPQSPAQPDAAAAPVRLVPLGAGRGRARAALFTTGLASLGMEVVWIRQLTPFLGNMVYSFAIILSVYLVATFLGSAVYRRWGKLVVSPLLESAWVWASLAVACLLPSILADPRLPLEAGLLSGVLRAILGIGPFCALLGFVTPLVMDRLTGGEPGLAGSTYALNVLGGILGPLLAGFGLLPMLSESQTLLVFALGILLLAAWPERGPLTPGRVFRRAGVVIAAIALAAAVVATSRSFEIALDKPVVRRDHTATVTMEGSGMAKRLRVNGVGMTQLTPITKMMAHLPLALLDHPPQQGLVVCFGMGTTFRSVYSWGIRVTGVELVPSVPTLFGLFHADGDTIARSPRSRIVVDDGRRFLEFDRGMYDVIIVDPPPPTEAAGTSLLYSVEFYDAARRRLRPGGTVQQWIPLAEHLVIGSFATAVFRSFPYVRAFPSIEGWGIHMIGSDRPIVVPSPEVLVRKLPAEAARDLVEWGPEPTPAGMFRAALADEIPFETLVNLVPGVPPLRDDRPVNEYFLVRRVFQLMGKR